MCHCQQVKTQGQDAVISVTLKTFWDPVLLIRTQAGYKLGVLTEAQEQMDKDIPIPLCQFFQAPEGAEPGFEVFVVLSDMDKDDGHHTGHLSNWRSPQGLLLTLCHNEIRHLPINRQEGGSHICGCCAQEDGVL